MHLEYPTVDRENCIGYEKTILVLFGIHWCRGSASCILYRDRGTNTISSIPRPVWRESTSLDEFGARLPCIAKSINEGCQFVLTMDHEKWFNRPRVGSIFGYLVHPSRETLFSPESLIKGQESGIVGTRERLWMRSDSSKDELSTLVEVL